MKLIPLSKEGKNRGKYFAMVDDEHYDFLMQWNWCAGDGRRSFYATRGRLYGITKMHRLLFNLTDPKIQVDHIDHNGLNNTMNNLRICTNNQNAKNKKKHKGSISGYLGVKPVRHNKKWKAMITVNGIGIYLGCFDTKEQAALARDKASIKYFGEFAELNFKKKNNLL